MGVGVDVDVGLGGVGFERWEWGVDGRLGHVDVVSELVVVVVVVIVIVIVIVVVVVVAGEVEEWGWVSGEGQGGGRGGLLLFSTHLLRGVGYFWIHLLLSLEGDGCIMRY